MGPEGQLRRDVQVKVILSCCILLLFHRSKLPSRPCIILLYFKTSSIYDNIKL